jgi:hypothetical protein
MPATATSSGTIGAIRITTGQHGEEGLGVFTQLPADGSFLITHDQATETTVKVLYEGSYCLVFRKDISTEPLKVRSEPDLFGSASNRSA